MSIKPLSWSTNQRSLKGYGERGWSQQPFITHVSLSKSSCTAPGSPFLVNEETTSLELVLTRHHQHRVRRHFVFDRGPLPATVHLAKNRPLYPLADATFSLEVPGVNAALLEAKLDPAKFPINNLLPQHLSQKAWFTNIQVPSMRRYVSESGKFAKLDERLRQLKNSGHRVLLYSQMTRMIDLIEQCEAKKQAFNRLPSWKRRTTLPTNLLSDADEAFWYADNKLDHPRRKRTKKRHDSDDDLEVVTRTTPYVNVLPKGGHLRRRPIQ